ncbi:hypothetical protein [Rhodopseudomonas boonkerdii]|uniref:hypothetical protein n=1 Tax=Rhodopseudomonas boonkerdii TaxID=475937 RepID=UPI001E49B545|nr:hypothetical protein [Rhodopseudomonas boonkerdii]
MTRVLLVLCSLFASGQSIARGSMATERPWASEHVEGLPADIRREVVARGRACGNAAAAAHYFSVSIEAGGRRFVSLHFEDLACTNRAAVCDGGGCLHEIYLESGGRHRLVFSVRTRDVRLRKEGGVAGIEVDYGTTHKIFRWNGARFVSVSAGLLAK